MAILFTLDAIASAAVVGLGHKKQHTTVVCKTLSHTGPQSKACCHSCYCPTCCHLADIADAASIHAATAAAAVIAALLLRTCCCRQSAVERMCDDLQHLSIQKWLLAEYYGHSHWQSAWTAHVAAATQQTPVQLIVGQASTQQLCNHELSDVKWIVLAAGWHLCSVRASCAAVWLMSTSRP
jgi:hypothetical protein